MITVLYRAGFYNYTLLDLKVKAGMVATFSGNRTVKICDHRSIPIGFFITDLDDSPYVSSSYGVNPTVTVAVGQGEYQTDQFERGTYEINDYLYCSSKGKVTNEAKYQGGFIIGIVNHIEDNMIGFVTCFARGLEAPYVELKPQKRRITRYTIAKAGD